MAYNKSEMDKIWDVFVVGDANIDYLARGPRLPEAGESVQGGQFLRAFGGKGDNQSVAVARLGGRAAVLACVGRDGRGDDIVLHLAHEGVETRWSCRRSNDPTGVVLIQVDEAGSKQTLAVPGANRHLSPQDLPRQAIAQSSVLLVSTGAPRDVVVAAVHLAKEVGAQVVLDPGPPQELPLDIYPLVDIIKPNAFEAEFLTGVEVRDRETARQAVDVLMSRGVGAVAIEAGGEGNLLVWKEGESWNPLLPVKVVDTTGAGDAFSAALAISLAEGWGWDRAGPFANAAAALATTALGAQSALPSRREVQALLAAQA